jgi:Zn-dependent peptidase ImmA (M78 family)
MPAQSRTFLSRNDIDAKAEEVLVHFDPTSLSRARSPIYEVVDGLTKRYHVPFHFDEELGYSPRGKKILGLYHFGTRSILIDKILPTDSPRFRWTLSHEIGHFILHRKIDPRLVSREEPQLVDTRIQLRFIRTACRSELEWIEWQANHFASALLLPRPILFAALFTIQNRLGIRRLGSIYLDDQRCNFQDYARTIQQMSVMLNVSRSVLRIRLLNLGILIDARRVSQDHVQNALRVFFSEENPAKKIPFASHTESTSVTSPSI